MTTKRFTIASPRHGRGAFTLAELLVSVAVLTLLVLMLTQLINNAAPIARTANKHIDTDTQARVVLDRMAVDFAKMLKRTDIDYYIKAPIGYKNPKSHGKNQKLQSGQLGNDQIAFFSQVPGYNSTSSSWQGPISLVAYRVNQDSTSASYLKLERMGKGLLWNGVSNPNQPPTNTSYTSPIVFIPLLITNQWPAATDGSTANSDYETIGPQVFRLEYYYLLKNGSVTDVPWDTTARPTQTSLTNPVNIGLTDVEAIAVTIAVIDPASRSLVFPTGALFNLMSDMADFKNVNGNGNSAKNIGDVENNWKSAVQSAAQTGTTSDGSAFPPAAAAAVRIYNRYFDLKTL